MLSACILPSAELKGLWILHHLSYKERRHAQIPRGRQPRAKLEVGTQKNFLSYYSDHLDWLSVKLALWKVAGLLSGFVSPCGATGDAAELLPS